MKVLLVLLVLWVYIFSRKVKVKKTNSNLKSHRKYNKYNSKNDCHLNNQIDCTGDCIWDDINNTCRVKYNFARFKKKSLIKANGLLPFKLLKQKNNDGGNLVIPNRKYGNSKMRAQNYFYIHDIAKYKENEEMQIYLDLRTIIRLEYGKELRAVIKHEKGKFLISSIYCN